MATMMLTVERINYQSILQWFLVAGSIFRKRLAVAGIARCLLESVMEIRLNVSRFLAQRLLDLYCPCYCCLGSHK